MVVVSSTLTLLCHFSAPKPPNTYSVSPCIVTVWQLRLTGLAPENTALDQRWHATLRRALRRSAPGLPLPLLRLSAAGGAAHAAPLPAASDPANGTSPADAGPPEPAPPHGAGCAAAEDRWRPAARAAQLDPPLHAAALSAGAHAPGFPSMPVGVTSPVSLVTADTRR
eukprot:COSAG01_NODE_4475_length_4988_cov_16.399264_2_plen_168_part_00